MFHTLMPPSLRLELSSAAKDAALDNRKAGAVCAVSKKKGGSDRASSPQTPAPATRVIETEIMCCCRIMYHLAADTRDLPAQCKRAQAPPATERCENGGKTRAAWTNISMRQSAAAVTMSSRRGMERVLTMMQSIVKIMQKEWLTMMQL